MTEQEIRKGLGTTGLPYGSKAAEEMIRDRIKKLEGRGYPDALAEPPGADA